MLENVSLWAQGRVRDVERLLVNRKVVCNHKHVSASWQTTCASCIRFISLSNNFSNAVHICSASPFANFSSFFLASTSSVNNYNNNESHVRYSPRYRWNVAAHISQSYFCYSHLQRSEQFSCTQYSFCCCSYMPNLIEICEQLLKLHRKTLSLLFCGHSVELQKLQMNFISYGISLYGWMHNYAAKIIQFSHVRNYTTF